MDLRKLGALRAVTRNCGLFICLLVLGCCAAVRRDATTVGRSSGEGGPERSGYADGVRGGSDGRTRGVEREDRAPSSDAPAKAKPAPRVVLYSGRLTLVTPSVEDALTRVEDAARRLGGHVQSSQGGRTGHPGLVVVRVPAARFDEAMQVLAAIGRVEERHINARDVTREFSDLQAALKLHERTRSRLYALLKRTVSTPERIKILREVRRLSEQIERMKAREKDISDRALFAVITVRLKPLAPEQLGGFGASPFAWVAKLGPASRFPPAHGVEMKRPDGFFDFSEEYGSGRPGQLYLSPGGTRIRAVRVSNEPRAHADFWKKAIQIEMSRRGYVALTEGLPSGAAGPLFAFQLEESGLERAYVFVFVPQGRHLFLAEAIFPSMGVFQSEGSKAMAALASFRPGKPGFYERFMIWVGL